jgi:hypothetical protein
VASRSADRLFIASDRAKTFAQSVWHSGRLLNRTATSPVIGRGRESRLQYMFTAEGEHVDSGLLYCADPIGLNRYPIHGSVTT